jgi:hypothetical protein
MLDVTDIRNFDRFLGFHLQADRPVSIMKKSPKYISTVNSKEISLHKNMLQTKKRREITDAQTNFI